MKNPHTISYRGYEIDPVSDPQETGAWSICELSSATHFRIFPPNISEPALDCAPDSLEEARKAVDEDLIA